MKLLSLRPMMVVNNVRTTIDYYVTHLHFTEVAYLETGHWGEVLKDGIFIMFTTGNELEPPHFAGTFYFNTDNVEAWWSALKDKAEIVYPVCDFEYNMREFAIKDCNGYTLQFGQPINL